MAADRTGAGKAGTLKVTQVRSVIGHNAATRGTVRALGLHRINHTVELADTPVTRGMLRRVAFLVEVEEPDAAATAENEGSK